MKMAQMLEFLILGGYNGLVRLRGCGLAGGSGTLLEIVCNSEVSEAHPRPILSICL